MRVIFEDAPTSALIKCLTSVFDKHTVIGADGIDNILKHLGPGINLVYVDIAFDNPFTIEAYNVIAASGHLVFPVPIPNMEYIYVKLCSKYGQVVDSETVSALLGMSAYREHNTYGSRNYENFCKAVSKRALSGCARLRANVAYIPRFLVEDCLCTTKTPLCIEETAVASKLLDFAMTLPLRPYVSSLPARDMQYAVRSINSMVTLWNKSTLSDCRLFSIEVVNGVTRAIKPND